MQHVVNLSQQRVKFPHVWLGALSSRQLALLREQQQQQGPMQQAQHQKGDVGSGLGFPRHFSWLCNAVDKAVNGQLFNQEVS
jgi:hypothetical protein